MPNGSPGGYVTNSMQDPMILLGFANTKSEDEWLAGGSVGTIEAVIIILAKDPAVSTQLEITEGAIARFRLDILSVSSLLRHNNESTPLYRVTRARGCFLTMNHFLCLPP